MKKFLPHCVWLSGLLVLVIGIAVRPGVPHQDPTTETRAVETRQQQRSQILAITGLCFFAGGVYWGFYRWAARRLSNMKRV